MILSFILGLRFFSNIDQVPNLFFITAVLLALGILASIIAGIIVTIQSIGSLLAVLQRLVTFTSVIFSLALVSFYQVLGLPAQFYNRSTLLVFFIGVAAVNLLLLLLNRSVAGDQEETIAVSELRFSNSFVIHLLLVAVLLLVALLLVPGYGLVVLLISLVPTMAFLPLMGSTQSLLQSMHELAVAVPSSRRVQNEIKALVQESDLLPIFQRNYVSLIVTILSLIIMATLSSSTAGDTNLGMIGTRMVTGIFIGAAGVYFLAESMSQSILNGIGLAGDEIRRLTKKVRSSKHEITLPDYEGFSSRISFYTYRRSLLLVGLPVAVVFVGGIALGSHFLSGLLLGALLCGAVFTFANRSQESAREATGLVISSLIFLTGLISLLLVSFFS